MRFLWESNAPWAGTGYATQTKLMLPALRELGHEPSCFAFWGLVGNKIEYDDYTVWPGSPYDPWGNDVVATHILRSESEALITLMDLFVMQPSTMSGLKVPWIGWVPIDCEDIGAATMERLVHCEYPVAMSNFGAKEMTEKGVNVQGVIPHAVDTEVFVPSDRRAARRKWEIPEDNFVIAMVMANKGDRKQYPSQFRAIRQFIDWLPEADRPRVRVHLHTENTEAMQGWDLKQVVDKCGLTGHVSTINRYDASVCALEARDVATVYQAADVVMNVSAGEGFGIPIVEAQACGIPVIVGDYTSMPELLNYGYSVPAANKGLAGHYGWQFNPNVDLMAEAIRNVYRYANPREAAAARDFVVNNFSVPVVAAYWDELLRAVADEQSSGAATMVVTRPEPDIPLYIKEARDAMAAEADEYGGYNARVPEYSMVYEELMGLGLQSGDRVLDLGAGLCDLDRYLRERGWWGTYVPVDMVIDGTNLERFQIPQGFEYIVIEQCIEHLETWQSFLQRCEINAGIAVIITTPNGEVVGHGEKEEFPGQMRHVVWLTEDDLKARGYDTYLATLTGRPGDTIIASKVMVPWGEPSGSDVSEDEKVGAST